MSTHNLKPGDRVRVTRRSRMRDYHPGDKGVVVRELEAGPHGTRYFLVKMDKSDLAQTGRVFIRDEIEPDV
jgi:hypothetical protein